MGDKPRRRRIAGPPALPGERLIRKYGNRRLYDTRESRYVTLEDLVEVFAGEEPVRVVDAVSGEDLTKRVLAQAILFEEGRRHTQILPLDLLRQLLRRRDKPLRRLLEAAEPRAEEPAGEPPPDEMAELKRRLKALETRLLKKPAPPARRGRA
jgi:polyhydroxyalkanoate synthesis repressor PhaR